MFEPKKSSGVRREKIMLDLNSMLLRSEAALVVTIEKVDKDRVKVNHSIYTEHRCDPLDYVHLIEGTRLAGAELIKVAFESVINEMDKDDETDLSRY